MHWLRGRGAGAFISVEAGRSPDAERTVRFLVRRLRSDLIQRQRRAGMRWGLLATVFEALGRDGRPKFNAHVIVVMPDADARDRLIESVHRSSVYAGHVDARPVENWNRLTSYLLKEGTSQAWFAAGRSFRRIRGSIPLGDLGGDRVVLSRDLRDLLIASATIQPFQRTYAKRQQSPPPGSNLSSLRSIAFGGSSSSCADADADACRCASSIGASVSHDLKAFFDGERSLRRGQCGRRACPTLSSQGPGERRDAALSAFDLEESQDVEAAQLVETDFPIWINLRGRLKSEGREVPISELDKRVKPHAGEASRGDGRLPGVTLKYDEIEPCDEPVDGAKLLTELSREIGAYVTMERKQTSEDSLGAIGSDPIAELRAILQIGRKDLALRSPVGRAFEKERGRPSSTI
jgi:hypothetical protein